MSLDFYDYTQAFDRREADLRLKAALELDARDKTGNWIEGQKQFLRLISEDERYKEYSPDQRVRIARNFAIRDAVVVAYRAELARGIFPYYRKRFN